MNVNVDETKFLGFEDAQETKALTVENQSYLKGEEEILPRMEQKISINNENSNDHENPNEAPVQSIENSYSIPLESEPEEINVGNGFGGGINGQASSHTSNISRETKWNRDHINDLIIGDPEARVKIITNVVNKGLYSCFLS